MNQIVLSSAYFPNIQYISKFLRHNNIIIDIYEHYSKQTYRNRCNILTSNGVLALSVPVKKNYHCFTKNIEIDYSENWQKTHERAILSAYKNSPFYDYYIDEISIFFKIKEKYLYQLNQKILDKILSILKIEKNYSFSTDFIVSDKILNLRDTISPKTTKNKYDPDFKISPYIQVFSDKFGFCENLSILDLIFMLGPVAIENLQ
ncbi:WbqC family protein [Bacteroidales bacterium OttesenSCG-928-I21]|nr:WbqC family protein [Bacteroidales bacterium OttesenSCG-928-I21]